jgi:hypothetical protein
MALVGKGISAAFLGGALVLAAALAYAQAPTAARPPAAAPGQSGGSLTFTPATPPPPTSGTVQEVNPARLALARQVMRAAPQLGNFDGILPDLMLDTQMRLINLRPDLYRQIATVVEGTASSLVPRRNDLDNDIARAWARSFNDDELRAIQMFFTSPAGLRYKQMAPQVGQDIIQAGQSWADRIASELYDRSLAELRQQGHKL